MISGIRLPPNSPTLVPGEAPEHHFATRRSRWLIYQKITSQVARNAAFMILEESAMSW